MNIPFIQGWSGYRLKQVFIECRAANESIFEKQIEKIEYYPQPKGHESKVNFGGFPFYYFKFKNEDDFENPIVAIQIEKKQISKDTSQPIVDKVEIECLAWAKGIDGDKDFISTNIEIDF